MSRFYGPGKSGYQPKKGGVQVTPKPPPSNPSGSTKMVIRFVLKSGVALELREETLEDVTGTWADKLCRAVCGVKVDGTKTSIPVDNVDYMEAVQ